MFLVSAKGSSATSEGASGALQASDFVLGMSTDTLKNVVIPGTKVPQKNNFSQFLAVLCSLSHQPYVMVVSELTPPLGNVGCEGGPCY